MDAVTLTLDELHRALSRCMEAHPPEGIELRLHPDANSMAGLWGLMLYERTTSVLIDQMEPAVLDAYRRWSDRVEGQ